MASHDAGLQTDVIILDFSRAFDTVPHSKLLYKLEHYGVRGPILAWLTSFLTERTMRVVLEGESSDEVAVESGVPQGTVLGPLLFLCHINDLPDSVKSTVRLFADDCLLYRVIRTFQDHLALQADLKRLEEWASQWGMRFNTQKCYVLPTKSKSQFFYSLGEAILQHVEQNPYLGIQLSSDLKWSTHITGLCKKIGSTIGFLRRNLQNCPQECRRLAYIALIRSSLEYAAVVWDPYLRKDIDKLECMQRQAARFITKDYRSRDPGCIGRMLDTLKLPPLEERRRQLRLTMLFKIANDLMPALPAGDFLTRTSTERRRVRPTTYDGYESQNILQRQANNNSRCYKVPPSKTDQFRNSFFVRTVVEWNNLPDAVVQLPSPSSFAAALGKQPATHQF